MITLVLGGTRSGKSEFAESLASAWPAVTYVATARVDPTDLDHEARIARHRARRPPAWETVECGEASEVPKILARVEAPVLLDSLGTWVAADRDLAPDVPALVAALRGRRAPTIVVGEEAGLAPHAPTDAGRRFVDALGAANRAVSEIADAAYLVVAGRPLLLPAPFDPVPRGARATDAGSAGTGDPC